jgi:hypothetical protein
MLLPPNAFARKTQKNGRECRKNKIKKRLKTKRAPRRNQRPSFGVFFLSSQLCASFKLQGLGLVWVQLPKEVFTKNLHKIITFVYEANQ